MDVYSFMIYDEQKRVVKIAAIVYGTDPQRNIRVLMRHNKPYDGKHIDEWTFVWGTVEENESLENAAKREVTEEFGLQLFSSVKLLEETQEFTGQHGKSIAHFCLIQIPDIEIPITLNEESIGYDWMLVHDAENHVRENEKSLLSLLDN